MSTKSRVVKGRGAELIPLVDKVGMAVNNGSDICEVAPLCGLNEPIELTHSNTSTFNGRNIEVPIGMGNSVVCSQQEFITTETPRRSKARDRAPSTVMMTKKLSRATRPGDVVTSTAVLGGLHHEYKLDHLAAYHRREFLRRTQIPATHCVILRFAK